MALVSDQTVQSNKESLKSEFTKEIKFNDNTHNSDIKNDASLKTTETDDCKDEKEKAETESSEKLQAKDKEECIEDVTFTINIHLPSGDTFQIPVSSMELVHEIHQMLMDREDTCHRTCFNLVFNDNILDNFTELKTIEGLKEGSDVKVQESLYNMREARIHVRHVRDMLKAMDLTDCYNGADFNSLSFLNTITQGDILEKGRASGSVDCTPPDYIFPGSKERPLTPLQPSVKEQKSPQCLKVFTLSGWNPPPGPRKMHGDLLYLFVITTEGKRYHLTSSTWGFYLNQSSENDFNPKPANPCYMSHSLIDLLNILSSSFKRNFANLQKKRTSRHPFERVATPYQVYTWAAPVLEHGIDAIRAEDASSSKLGYEEHIPGQTRDWNEELQTTRELPRRTITERLVRERAIFKVHSDFVSAATRGAQAVIDGHVMAINPGEDSKMQMFIWNNLFFSLGFDVRDHYLEFGGDAAAHAAPKNDLQGVRVFSAVDLEGLHTLGTAVIDYRGYRVTAQSIIPGILEKEQEQSVVYGSIDFGKTIVTNPKYLDLLQKAAVQLKILPHKVLNEKKEVVELCSSIECKGIIGNDGRYYILDLIRTFPPDVNFLPLEEVGLCTESRKMGLPIKHKHKLGILRQELIDAFVENRYMMFLKYAALHLQHLSIKKNESDMKMIEELNEKEKEKEREMEKEKDKEKDDENKKEKDNKDLEAEEAKKIVKTVTDNIAAEKQVEENTKDIIRKAAIAVGSLKVADFDVRFNPDLFSSGVNHVDPESERIGKEKQLIIDAADFLVKTQFPNLIHDLSDFAAAPTDGGTLSDALHTRGINIRYLGKVANQIIKTPTLKYIHTIAVADLITRAVKHIFRDYLQNVENITLSLAVSHFLNCFLSSCTNPHGTPKNDELTYKRRRKKHPFSNNVAEWASLSPKSLWFQIKTELRSYFDWKLTTDSIDSTIEKYGVQKISLLRSFCTNCGVQIMLRDYNFDSRNQETFKDEDILNLFPKVKHVNPRASDAFNLYTEGQNKIQQGFLKSGYDLISEALNLLNNVYGPIHPEIAQCQRMLARLNYIMGDYVEAMSFQQRATLMSERVNGIDHPYTVTEYTHLALYCFANQQVSVALKLLYRARYLLLLIHGEVHPEVAIIDANIGLILHAVGQYSLSLQFLENFLALQVRFYGDKSLKVALSYHLVARTQSCMGDFRGALKNEKETFAIYKSQLGPEHEKTKEADECLKHLTQQAVVMAKKINDAFNGRVSNGIPPIQIHSPSLSSVLDLLNIINGIKYVAITTAEIERVRLELEKGHLKMITDNEKVVPLTTTSSEKTTAESKESDTNSDTSEPKTDESELKSEDDDDPTSR